MKKLIFLALASFLYTSIYAQVGIGTTDPKSTLDINGNLSLKVVNYNGGPGGSATPINDGIYLNLVPTAGNVEFILPDASTVPGRVYIMRNIADSQTATIYSFGGQFYAGDNRVGLNSITMASGDGNSANSYPSKTITVISDGVNWTFGHFHL